MLAWRVSLDGNVNIHISSLYHVNQSFELLSTAKNDLLMTRTYRCKLLLMKYQIYFTLFGNAYTVSTIFCQGVIELPASVRSFYDTSVAPSTFDAESWLIQVILDKINPLVSN